MPDDAAPHPPDAAPVPVPVPAPGPGVVWLSPTEKDTWSALVAMLLLLPGRLEAPLQRATGLSLFEYLVLSHTSEAPGREMRMGELARLANGSLSRLSNVVKRLEGHGWMRRRSDPSDGRYTLAALTDEGWAVVARAAPVHVNAVREVAVDRLEPQDHVDLVRMAARLGVDVRRAEIDPPSPKT